MASSLNTSSSDIMNVREVIDRAFGDLQGNAVNFKLVQTILFLFARQMRLLERRVEIQLGPSTLIPSESTLSVTEVKINTTQKKKKDHGGKPSGGAKVKSDGEAKRKPASAGTVKPAGAGTVKPAGAGTVKPDGGAGADKETGKKPDDYSDTLNALEVQRERELRVIHQRADSFEEAKKSPTPMASASSIQAQYEKLLVVKTIPSSEARKEDIGNKRMSLISLVTQKEFEKVADTVRELEKALLPVGSPGFPENAELMQQLRKGASLTDAMAALQLSARLDATEKALTQMTLMITQLVKQTPGVTIDSETQTLIFTDPYKLKDDADEGKCGNTKHGKGKSVGTFDGGVSRQTEATSETGEAPGSEASYGLAGKREFVTQPDLDKALKQIKAELIKSLEAVTKSTKKSENALKLQDAKIDYELMADRMAYLENAVIHYADQIHALDTHLSSQMTAYQEQLTQMQHNLEVGLDTLNEVLGNAGSDTVAVADLNVRFKSLQMDFDNMAYEQKTMKDIHNLTTNDLANLWEQVEMLRESKSDREEVADALRDKAGIGELNGLVSIDQFEAVRGDFAKRIGAAFQKFNAQEKSWHKSLKSSMQVFNEKADLVQVQCLKGEIDKYLNKFKNQIQVLTDIVGEPKSAMVSKKIFRDTVCLSCGSPAHMDLEEPNKVPALPKFHSTRQPAEGDEPKSETIGGGDYGICYPDTPIPQQTDPRSHLCKRYCGGSHTVLTKGSNRSLPGMTLKPLEPINTAPGTDGKIPCLPCNTPKSEEQGDSCDNCDCSK